MKVTDPAGEEFRVRRRWLPWRWRKRISGKPWDIDPLSGLDLVDGFGAVIASIALLIALVFLVPVVLLVLLTGVEFLLLLLVLPVALIGRLVLGKHWQVEVRQGWKLRYEVDGGDWSQSRVVIDDLANRIALGQLEPPASSE